MSEERVMDSVPGALIPELSLLPRTSRDTGRAAGAGVALSTNKNTKSRVLLIPKGAMAASDHKRMFPSGTVAMFQAGHFGSPTFLLFPNYCEILLDAIEQLLRSNPDVRKLYLEFILKALG